ncbi:octopamine receptor-like [Physella acuta]|uniref:octopamine receptor-like n=1 Tax=Physella acuta TaxID=109671 RepID=UPI0027DE6103|nr:octopamine receptor-like [Physella acuta]
MANISNTSSHLSVLVSSQEAIFRVVYLTLVSLWTVVGNALVLVAVFRFKSLRRATNVMLGSLALADFLVGTVTVPLYTLWTVNPVVFDRSTFMCGLVLLSCLLVVTASQISLIILSIEQYFAVCWPFQHRDALIRFPWLHATTVTFTWAISFVTTGLSFFAFNTEAKTCSYYGTFDKNFLFIASIVGVTVPFIIIIFLNLKVLCTVRDHDRRRFSLTSDKTSDRLVSRSSTSDALSSSYRDDSQSFKSSKTTIADEMKSYTPSLQNLDPPQIQFVNTRSSDFNQHQTFETDPGLKRCKWKSLFLKYFDSSTLTQGETSPNSRCQQQLSSEESQDDVFVVDRDNDFYNKKISFISIEDTAVGNKERYSYTQSKKIPTDDASRLDHISYPMKQSKLNSTTKNSNSTSIVRIRPGSLQIKSTCDNNLQLREAISISVNQDDRNSSRQVQIANDERHIRGMSSKDIGQYDNETKSISQSQSDDKEKIILKLNTISDQKNDKDYTTLAQVGVLDDENKNAAQNSDVLSPQRETPEFLTRGTGNRQNKTETLSQKFSKTRSLRGVSFEADKSSYKKQSTLRKSYSLSSAQDYNHKYPNYCVGASSSVTTLSEDSKPRGRAREGSVGRFLSPNNSSASRRVANMLALVCATFILAWCPFFVVIMINTFCEGCHLTYFLNAVIMMAFTKSGTNPVVYALCHVAFRRAYSKVLASFCCLKRSNNKLHRSQRSRQNFA